MIKVTRAINISETELQFEFVRASGPGGQNVNKVETAVQVRFDLQASSLPRDVKSRLSHISGKRINGEGVLVISARNFRTQEQNREEAVRKLLSLIRRAAVVPKPRKKTNPTRSSIEKRLEVKKKRGEIKKYRYKGDL